MEKEIKNDNELLLIKDVENGLNNIYLTLQELNIKATTMNTKYMFGIYSELERISYTLQSLKEMGGENV